MDLSGDRGVEGHFHLVDGDRIGVHRDGLFDGRFPFVFDFAQHAGDQVDVDLLEADLAHPLVGAEDFGRLVGAAVGGEHLVIEMFDAQRKASDADLLDRLQFGLSLSVPGSHSKVTSLAASQVQFSLMRSTMRSSWALERKEGVPPPK